MQHPNSGPKKSQSEYSSKYQTKKSPKKSPGAYLSPFKEDKFGALSPSKNGHLNETYGRGENSENWNDTVGSNPFKGRVMPDGSSLNWDIGNDWPAGAVKCDEKKTTRVEGDRRVTKVLKYFTMADGSIETKEYSSVDLV